MARNVEPPFLWQRFTSMGSSSVQKKGCTQNTHKLDCGEQSQTQGDKVATLIFIWGFPATSTSISFLKRTDTNQWKQSFCLKFSNLRELFVSVFTCCILQNSVRKFSKIKFYNNCDILLIASILFRVLPVRRLFSKYSTNSKIKNHGRTNKTKTNAWKHICAST